MIDLLIASILGIAAVIVTMGAVAFLVGLADRNGVTMNPLDHYLRFIDWAYRKGRGER